MSESTGERWLTSKPNRAKKLAKRERGSQVVYRPMGLASFNRVKSKKRKNKEIADVVKRARR